MENGRPGIDREALPARPQDTAPKVSPWISISLASVAGMAIVAGLFMLMLQIGGPLAIVAVLVFGLGGLIALFHYVVWGWWLSGTIREEVAAEERAAHDKNG